MQIQASDQPRLSAQLSPEQLRRDYLVAGLFQVGQANFRWWETDRSVLGAVMPGPAPLPLENDPELRAAFFLERREAGVINLGGAGTIEVDGVSHAVGPFDALYLGRGAKSVLFSSADAAKPARFWVLSYPAHHAYPTRLVPFKDVTGVRLGTRESANERTLFKMIHPGAFPTCQLVMGFTRLDPGSVWNTMPPHTHLRRSEIYLYFDVPENQAVFHFMGAPDQSRHLIVRDLEAVLSPPWSIHCGAGTCAYSFVWGMGGENQEFADMDAVSVANLL